MLLLAAVRAIDAREQSHTRRRLQAQQQQQQSIDNAAADDNKTKPHSFYDLSPLSSQEKIQMLHAAIRVTQLGSTGSIDWDAQKDRFREAVWSDLGGADRTDSDTSSNDNQIIASSSTTATRRLQKSIDGDVFDQYEYSTGACPDAGSLGVPCPPSNLPELCNKYDAGGSFRDCFNACGPAFCCIHDADPDSNYLAPNCNTDENCPGYNWCYIAWWKMHDTIGPALFLRLEQDDDFYDIKADEIEEDVTNDPVFNQILLHHFDDIEQIIEDGTVVEEDGSSNFNADRIFLDPEYWDTDI